jgi:hypothetical protein
LFHFHKICSCWNINYCLICLLFQTQILQIFGVDLVCWHLNFNQLLLLI